MTYQEIYSKFYDQIHNTKEYSLETNVLQKFIQTEFPRKKIAKVLDFGCGTGNHLSSLAGYAPELYGYDRSQAMLRKALENFPTLSFTSDFERVPKNLDLVYSLFDVCSYQVSRANLIEYFEMMASKLGNGGLLILDGWYLPGVRLSPPEYRERNLELGDLQVLRCVTPRTNDSYQTTELAISLVDKSDGRVISTEEHLLRAFTMKEILDAATVANFKEIGFRDGKNWAEPLEETSWRFMMYAIHSG
ncbi:unannotated protein [freshwater metagenome]|uniref:Unannotated protein n=1 Tax=freshwater metagenome TaxID=449393 RepID=A0A6J7V0P0_9ZZZZ